MTKKAQEVKPNKVDVIELPLVKIKPYWRNARNISQEAIDAVAKSIEQYGYNVLITVDSKGVIVTGHTRYMALTKLGWKKAQVIELDLPAAKIKEFRIADNKSSEFGEWNNEKLIQELRELADIENMQVFFPDTNLPDWLNEDTGSQGSQEVTQQQVNDTQERLGNKFSQDSKENSEKEIELVCPDCGHTYFVKRNEILIDGGK